MARRFHVHFYMTWLSSIRNETNIAMELFHHSLDLYHHYYQQQMEDYDESYAHHRQKVDPIQLETVQVHRNIAECHVVAKDFTAAIASFLLALEIQRKAAAARCINNKCMMECTEDSSLDDSDKSPTAVPSRTINNHKEFANDESIADTLRRLGKTYLAVQRHQRSTCRLIRKCSTLSSCSRECRNPRLGRSHRDRCFQQTR
jgi:tetratricopeptide (TPR) repeat protein